jgi:hypothetical protein
LPGQFVQAGAPASEYWFTRQPAQAAGEVAAVDGDAVPLSQALHSAVPLLALNLPDAHARHTSEAGRRYPLTCTLFRMTPPWSPLMMYRYFPRTACVHATTRLGAPGGHSTLEAHKVCCSMRLNGSALPILMLKLCSFNGSIL